MTTTITRDRYESANAFTTLHWPAHNREQGITWDLRTYGLLAKRAGELVGAATIKIIGGSATLEQIVVAHGRTHEGIGSALLHEFERLARDTHCHVMELETAESQARPFYEKHGFRVIAIKPNSKFGQTWYLMQKPIPA